MKKRITYLLSIMILGICVLESCLEDPVDQGFYPIENLTIAGYLEEKKDSISSYYTILEELGLLQSLSAYNPAGNGFTLFLPTDSAFDSFFKSNADYNSLDELIADQVTATAIALYHIVNSSILTVDFPFGSLPDTTATGDFLTVSVDTVSQQPLINGVARINRGNIELTNGYIHEIDYVLEPVTSDLSEWILANKQYSIMAEVFSMTGLLSVLENDEYHTLLLENNQVLKEAGIKSVTDLEDRYSPENVNYTHPGNGLYQFAAYHLIEGIYYLDDFEGSEVLYNTKTIYPVNVNGESLTMKVNEGVTQFDTLISGPDTTIIDYIGFNFESSNNQAVNGTVHSIDQLMGLYLPERTEVINQFFNEPEINSIRNDPGETVFSNQADFTVLQWEGTDEITYVKSDQAISGVWNNDYIVIEGSFRLAYEIPRILPGKYHFYLAAHAFDDRNASIQISIDGNQVGGNLDLTSGGTSSSPYYNFFLATLDFSEYSGHEIEIVTLIPGTLSLDRFTFEPIEQ